MRRRQVLAVGVVVIAGCTSSPSPPDDVETPPNVFLDFEWTGSAYDVTFEYGTTITDRNTKRLAFHDEATGDEVVWVAREEDAIAAFPLEPGASVELAVDRETKQRLVWEPPGGRNSASLTVFEYDEGEDGG